MNEQIDIEITQTYNLTFSQGEIIIWIIHKCVNLGVTCRYEVGQIGVACQKSLYNHF